MNIDKRKKYILTLDVETAGNVEKNPLVYDLGFTISDKLGNIYSSHSFVIEEIFDQKELMETAYYAKKLPIYHEGLRTGAFRKVPFMVARTILIKEMDEYNVKQVGAYNLGFDMRALNNTLRTLDRPIKDFFRNKAFRRCEFVDVWSMACQTICLQKGYKNFCLDNGLYSKAGNYKTSAETVYSYITNNPNYVEHHTGLEDCKIEAKILAYALKQKKKIHEKFCKTSKYTWRYVTQIHGKVSAQ